MGVKEDEKLIGKLTQNIDTISKKFMLLTSRPAPIKINLLYFMEYVKYSYLQAKDRNLMFVFDIKRKYNYCKNILVQSEKELR